MAQIYELQDKHFTINIALNTVTVVRKTRIEVVSVRSHTLNTLASYHI